MKFRIRSVSVSCSTTSSRNGRLKIVEIELSSLASPIARPAPGFDHDQDEHGGERRDGGVGDGPGGEPLEQEHEQRKDTRKWNRSASCVPSRAEVLAQLVMAERRRQQQERRQQQRAKAQRVPRDPLRDHLKQLDDADHHQRDARQEGQQAERLLAVESRPP